MTMSCDDAGTKPVRFEVFTGAGRRREWADETRARILAESYADAARSDQPQGWPPSATH